MADRQLADLNKNGRERVRIMLAEYKGARFVDIRIFATNAEAALVPTPKGVGIRPSMLRATIEALLAAERAFVAEGLIDSREGSA